MRAVFRNSALVVTTLSFFFAAFSVAAASPTPTPSPSPQAPAGRNGPSAKEGIGNLLHPTAKPKSGKPRWPKAPKTPKLDGASKPIRALVSDWSSGRLSKNRASQAAAEMLRSYLGVSATAESRYQGSLDADDALALAGLAAESGEAILPTAAPQTSGVLYIDPITQLHSVTTDHFIMSWSPFSLNTDFTDDDNDGIPNVVAATLDKLADAWAFYHDDLGMTGPDGHINVWWSNPLGSAVDYRAASWPTHDIFLPADYTVDYLPVHELFHQFQWPYLTAAWSNLSFWGNTLNINWWMEATAEWATTQYALARTGRTSTVPGSAREAASLPEFLSTTGKKLSYGNFTLTTDRQYGAVAVVELFTEIFDQDFVRRTWKSVEGQGYLNGTTQLDDTLYEHYWGDMAYWTSALWSDLYTECDPVTVDEGWQSEVFATWCNTWVTEQGSPLVTSVDPAGWLGRPDHGASSSRRGSSTSALGGGGAVFQDIALPASAVGTDLHVYVTSADTSSLRAYVYSWNETPGDQCPDPGTYDASGTPDPDSGMLSAAIAVTSGCTNVTVMVVDNDVTHPQRDVTVSWSSHDPGAIISNGTVTLGVWANGSLNGQVNDVGLGVGLVYEATGTDGLNSFPPPDNYLLIDTERSEIVGGVYWGGELGHDDVTVLDFWSTGSTAESIVQAGRFQIVQYFHPSSNGNAYRLDVTVRKDADTGLSSDTSLTYRRAMTTVAPYDDTFAVPSYVTYVGGSNVQGYTNVPRGSDLAATDHLQPVDLADVTPWESSRQGFGMDVQITAAHPKATLYYGAAGSLSSAASVVADLGADTYGLCTPQLDGTSTTFILAR